MQIGIYQKDIIEDIALMGPILMESISDIFLTLQKEYMRSLFMGLHIKMLNL